MSDSHRFLLLVLRPLLSGGWAAASLVSFTQRRDLPAIWFMLTALAVWIAITTLDPRWYRGPVGAKGDPGPIQVPGGDAV